MKTSGEITQELDLMKNKVRSLEHELKNQQETVTALTRRRKEIAFEAHGEGSEKAKVELERVHRKAFDAGSKVEDLESAVLTAREKHEALMAEHDRIVKEEYWQSALSMIEDIKKDASEIDDHMKAYLRLRSKHQDKILKVQQAAKLAGRAAFATMGSRHIDRRFDALLYIASEGKMGNRILWGKVYTELSYSEILQRQIDGQKIETDSNDVAA